MILRVIILWLACLALAQGATPAKPEERDSASGLLPVADEKAREALPEYQVIPAATAAELTDANGWPAMESYGVWHRSLGGPTSSRFSTLDQINTRNVKQLTTAWIYHSQDGFNNVQCNPIVVDEVMYLPTAGRRIVALDAATGRELWTFAPELGSPIGLIDNPARRGLMYWPGDRDNPPRVIFTCNYWIYALDPKTGRLIGGFGEHGRTRLPTGGTVGGAVYKTIYIVPGFDGDVFGYDVRTGALLWRFHTIPEKGEFGYDTWETRISPTGANCWGGMALDESRGIAYIATGSPKPNFSGLTHLGDNLFGSSLIAIKAETGERLWHFQGVRHDIWDLDMGSPPNLVTITIKGRRVDAVVEIDKNGTVYLLDRVTGKPIFPFHLRRAPVSRIPGEVTAPYQPSPELPERVSKQVFERSDITTLSPAATASVEQQLVRARLGFFDPPDYTRPTIINGLLGGTDWPGSAFDPRTGYLYCASSHTPWIITLRADDDPAPATPPTAGDRTYQQFCAVCHGAQREGLGVVPPLVGLRHRLSDDQVIAKILKGGGAMPPQAVPEGRLPPLLDFLMARDRGSIAQATPTPERRRAIPFNGYPRLLDGEGYPGSKPPWGTLDCLDLNTGRMRWSVPLGEYKELTQRGVPKTGTENLGGATITAGNLVFVGGTRDYKFRAFDTATGEELWSGDVPAYGASPPTVYAVKGREYVVICASGRGHMQNNDDSDAWVAFALPAGSSDVPAGSGASAQP